MPLPLPSADASAHSEQLREHMAREIGSSGGWIDFARYMELALYAPGLGYYSAGAAKLGASGDYVTAPEISSLFGRTLARPIAQTLRSIGGDVLELGAGSGKLAVDLLSELESLNALPGTYFILELSADLRQRQQMLIRERAPRLAPRLVWLDALPNEISGVVLANEVLDALPVHIVRWTEGDTVERGVMIGKHGFAWQDRPITNPDLARRATHMRPGQDYVSEISLAVPALIHSVGRMLRHGQAIFIDYGFLHDEFYHPQRTQGTLMCHYRHRAHDDPFFLPGLQDITAHVDFTTVEGAAREAGLAVAGYSTQARFLLDCGITELLRQVDAADAPAYLPLANQVLRLTSPAEMGELFKVIVLARERG